TALGVLLFQDLVAVVFLALIPVLGDIGADSFALLLATASLKGGLLFALLMAAGKWVLPRIYRDVARGGADEVFVLATLVIVLAVKGIAVAGLVRLLGVGSAVDAGRVGLVLAQAGEFGLALITLALLNELVPSDQGSFVIMILVFSMMLSPVLIRNNGALVHR